MLFTSKSAYLSTAMVTTGTNGKCVSTCIIISTTLALSLLIRSRFTPIVAIHLAPQGVVHLNFDPNEACTGVMGTMVWLVCEQKSKNTRREGKEGGREGGKERGREGRWREGGGAQQTS